MNAPSSPGKRANASPAGRSTIGRSERTPFEELRQWVYERTGIHYPPRKDLILYHRLKKVCWRTGIPDLATLIRHLRDNDLPGLAREVACAVSTNHTYFFREEKSLSFFKHRVLPTLPEIGSSGDRWRLWSAACSSGEEAYTIAMILTEVLGREQACSQARSQARSQAAILGTDIDRNMIEQAEIGLYHQQRVNSVPPHLINRYFKSAGPGQWLIDAELKRMCTFRRLNLMSAPWPFKRTFHVIFCRNVMYYFDLTHQRALAERLYDATAPGGWLITSVTEPVQTLGTRWRAAASGIYRKV